MSVSTGSRMKPSVAESYWSRRSTDPGFVSYLFGNHNEAVVVHLVQAENNSSTHRKSGPQMDGWMRMDGWVDDRS